MAGINEDIRLDMEAMNCALVHFRVAMFEFMRACARRDRNAIERAQLRAVGSVEAQLDAIAAAHLRMPG